MSLVDVYRKSKVSLVGRIRPSRFFKDRLPDQRIEGWSAELNYLRSRWRDGHTTEMETSFLTRLPLRP